MSSLPFNDEDFLNDIISKLKSNYYKQINDINDNKLKQKIINEFNISLQNTFDRNLYLDKLAEEFSFFKTDINSILTKNNKDKNSHLYLPSA